MPTKIRDCDAGTEFAEALTAGEETGPASATDPQNMAMFCEDIMPLMAGLGGFSPRLVWEGAQKAGLTTLQLHEICHRKDFAMLDDLQFS
jgi:hypothetical protein